MPPLGARRGGARPCCGRKLSGVSRRGILGGWAGRPWHPANTGDDMRLFSKVFGNPEKRRAEEAVQDIEKKMGRGFASMICGDCSPSTLPPQFFWYAGEVYSIFNEIIALRTILVVALTYAYFGEAKDKADRVLDSFFASLPAFMQTTGNYTEEQLRQFGRNQKAPHDRY